MSRPKLPAKQKASHGRVSTRVSKVQRQDAERLVAAEVLADQPVGTQLEPPSVLKSAHYAKALEIWNELGPELERTNRLQPIHKPAFAMFCIYMGEWWTACEDLATNGRSQNVATVAGGFMERDRPSVRWRAEAFAAAQAAAQQFGLTPREEYALFKGQAEVAQDNPGLFGRRAVAQPANDSDAAAPAARASSIGAMSRHKSSAPVH